MREGAAGLGFSSSIGLKLSWVPPSQLWRKRQLRGVAPAIKPLEPLEAAITSGPMKKITPSAHMAALRLWPSDETRHRLAARVLD